MRHEVLQGDVLARLRELPAESVHCCVTSPPYWGLRDYGTATWEGGDAGCDHTIIDGPVTTKYRLCRCGARRIDQQLSLEPTPEQYVARMVEVFREVRRALRDDGTLFLNVGDSYYAGGWECQRVNNVGGNGSMAPEDRKSGKAKNIDGLKMKDLVGIPWLLAFALRADGWYLRSDIIWSKPNPMPESVTDRPTKAHEYVFLLAKSQRYYYDAEAVKEESVTSDPRRPYTSEGAWQMDGRPPEQRHGGELRKQDALGKATYTGFNGRYRENPVLARNRRTVWTIPTQPYPEAHFATYPEALVEPCIKAGCPEGGTVIDPFLGSGTTLAVAAKLGRSGIGIELNPAYVALAKKRIGLAKNPHTWRDSSNTDATSLFHQDAAP